jgi:RHS repeat-associated protein
MRRLYDGLSFEVIREGETYGDGSFTTRDAQGSMGTENRGTEGSRYRWVSEGVNEVRTRVVGEYREGVERYRGIKVTLYGRGEGVGVVRSTSVGSGTVYLRKDLIGSVKTATNGYGALEGRYAGELAGGMDLGYTGKGYDVTTGLYDYGYRDYKPEAARFTTIDPVRDGVNWYTYVSNDPVNWVDPDGFFPVNILVGAGIGFVFSTASELGSRIASGQSFTTAISDIIHDPVAIANIATSTVMGVLTSGASSFLTNGVTQAGKIATTNIIVNTVGGAVDAAAKNVIDNAITGKPQSVSEIAAATVVGAASAFVFSGLTQEVIAVNTTRASQNVNVMYGTGTNVQFNPLNWAGAAGIIGENVIPTAIGIVYDAITKEGKNH